MAVLEKQDISDKKAEKVCMWKYFIFSVFWLGVNVRQTNISFFSVFYLWFSSLFKFCFHHCLNWFIWLLKLVFPPVVSPGRYLSLLFLFVPCVHDEYLLLPGHHRPKYVTLIPGLSPPSSLKQSSFTKWHAPCFLRAFSVNSDSHSYLTKYLMTFLMDLITFLISKIAPLLETFSADYLSGAQDPVWADLWFSKWIPTPLPYYIYTSVLTYFRSLKATEADN